MPVADPRPRGLRETARIVGVPPAWLRAQAEAGKIPCLRADGVLLFSVEAVQRALVQLATNANPGNPPTVEEPA